MKYFTVRGYVFPLKRVFSYGVSGIRERGRSTGQRINVRARNELGERGMEQGNNVATAV